MAGEGRLRAAICLEETCLEVHLQMQHTPHLPATATVNLERGGDYHREESQASTASACDGFPALLGRGPGAEVMGRAAQPASLAHRCSLGSLPCPSGVTGLFTDSPCRDTAPPT